MSVFRHPRKPRLHVRLRSRVEGWRRFRPVRGAYRRATRSFRTDRGSRVWLFTEGNAAYEAMLAAIAEARSFIHLEMYMFESDGIGWRFASALMEKARAGVAVRIVYDAVGSLFTASAFWNRLEAAGAEVRCYHPLAPWRIGWHWNRRDHRKILLVDGSVGFTGGMNISDDHIAIEEGGGGWRDVQLRIEGPAVADLQLVFFHTWLRTGGHQPENPDALFPVAPFEDGLPVRVVSNRTFRSRRTIRGNLLEAIRRAERSIHITHAYFIPDPGLQSALIAAVRRGVNVHLIVPAHSDIPIALAAGRAAQPALLRNGVRVSRRLGRILHSKITVVDARWVSVGSDNLNYRSLLHNQEVNVEIDDPEFGARMEEVFQGDLARSEEIGLDDLAARPRLQKLLDSMAYGLRFWL